ncbi:MAG TPA: tRNA (N6-isopentenyl adenosine(37)-C2)-methylthiotransferase MiaB [Tepidisphaeraceae bacterium]|nr:tRNA (N6-isopentenyl adenosine(37)-C2)-methylthiotransferase MiaB [Tepidisphaeraceae bacterium]
MPRKLYLETFGCQMNVLDSELVLGQLRAQGYESVEQRDEADVIIYNTCSVREHAEQKVWSRLGELRERKRQEPGLVIGVIGCMAERDGTNIFKRHPHVDVLCGPGELDKLAQLVHNAVVTAPHSNGKRHRQVALMGSNVRRSGTLEAAEDTLELLDLSRSISAEDVAQAYVRITRGCNKFCTYCVVPYTRGPEVHRPPGNIVEEVKRLTDAGAREVTLLGQTINHYHYKHGDGRTTSFAELLYQIHESAPDLPRLRFVTSYPRDFGDDALAAMRDCPRICRYLHAPAQSGSNRILKLMNRGYTVEEYRDLVDRAREMMPDVCIASDFIVGFPTETDGDFESTRQLVRSCRFKNSFIFKYSPRPGTLAIQRFEDNVPEDVKRRRNNVLLADQQDVCDRNNREMIGKTVQVLVEGVSKLINKPAYPRAGSVELGWEKRRLNPDSNRAPVQLTGRTAGDQVVAFDGNPSLKGQIIEIEIIDARNLTLFGKLSNPASRSRLATAAGS